MVFSPYKKRGKPRCAGEENLVSVFSVDPFLLNLLPSCARDNYRLVDGENGLVIGGNGLEFGGNGIVFILSLTVFFTNMQTYRSAITQLVSYTPTSIFSSFIHLLSSLILIVGEEHRMQRAFFLLRAQADA
jgi:hypothetical protein